VQFAIDKGKIAFTEYELLQGSQIVLPNHYEGTLLSGLVSGTYKPNEQSQGGVFYLEAVQDPLPQTEDRKG
jgi:hypothetical protein